MARKTSQVSSEAQAAALSTPSFASSSSAPSKARVGDQQRDREADPGDRAAADDGSPADRRAQPSAAQPRDQPGRAGDPDRLAEHVAEEDPERDRRGIGAGRESRRRSRCRHWPARRAARSRSSSRGGRAAAGGRWARPPPAARPVPSGRAPESAARGICETGPSRAPARRGPPGMPRSSDPRRVPERRDRRPTRTAPPRLLRQAGSRRGRGGSGQRGRASIRPKMPAAISSGAELDVRAVDERDDAERDGHRRRRRS